MVNNCLPDSNNCSYTVRVTAMLEDMADFWYITKTPNKTSQKHQTKQRKNTKQNNAKTPNKTPQKHQTACLINKKSVSLQQIIQQTIWNILKELPMSI